jgi:hypothetical protein
MPPPESLRPLFWDVAFESLDVERDQDTIIARIAEHGTDEAVRWMRRSYPDAEIARALEARVATLSGRTLGLWRIWLRKPEDWCAKTPSRPLKGSFWKP